MRLTKAQRKELSTLTKEGLERAREAGKKLGCPDPRIGAKLGGKASAKLRTAAAIARDIPLLKAAGLGSLSERAARLNAAGYRSTEGKPFTVQIMSRMVRRSSQKP